MGTVGTLLLENPLGQNGLSHQGLLHEAAKVFGLRSRKLKLFLNETQTQGKGDYGTIRFCLFVLVWFVFWGVGWGIFSHNLVACLRAINGTVIFFLSSLFCPEVNHNVSITINRMIPLEI